MAGDDGDGIERCVVLNENVTASISSPSLISRICRAVIALEGVWLLLLLPLVLFPSPARTPVLLLLPALWLCRKLAYGRFTVATPLDSAVLLLLLMVLVSLWATFDIAFSLPKITGMVYGVALFYAVVAWAGRSTRHLWGGVALLLGCGLGVAALGLVGTRWSSKLPLIGGVIDRLPARLLSVPGGEGFNPNEVAGVLLWMTPLTLALTVAAVFWLLDGRWPARWQAAVVVLLTGGSSLLLGGLLLLTQSRGALLGFGVALIVMLLLAAGTRPRWLLAAVGLLLLAVIAVMNVNGPEFGAAALFETTGQAFESASVVNSLAGRQEIWSRAIYGIQDFPFTGMGMNTFRRVVHILYPLFLISPETDLGHAHNHLLQTGLDLGIPGLVAYLALWLGLGGMLWQVWRRNSHPGARMLVAGFAGCLIAYAVYGMVDAVALGARPGFILWLLWGLIAALHRVNCELS